MIGDLYGDYSRLTFDREKHYSAVLTQQGRVSVDADPNEQVAIDRHRLETLMRDLLGLHAAPAGDNANFAVALDTSSPNHPVLSISPGHLYVDGALVEAEEKTAYYEQPDAYLDDAELSDQLPVAVPYVVYLKVWERHISAVEDPAIREIALGVNGPDTSARTKIVWQVRADAHFPPGSDESVADWDAWDRSTGQRKWSEWEQQRQGMPRPQLRAKTTAPDDDDLTPCITPPEASYRGLENQLYRVEIHTGGSAADATWKWSRDNGAAVFAVESISGVNVTVASLGRDLALGVRVGDWVELVDDRSVLRGERHRLLQVKAIDLLERIVTLASEPDGGVGTDPALHPLLRRWDQRHPEGASDYASFDAEHGVLRVAEGGWLRLESGIEVQFQSGGAYTAGDFWLIPARTAIADIEWPRENADPLPRPPMGITYAYAPLAVIDKDGAIADLRRLFSPIAV
jgi:hypothetical protein